MSSKSGTIIPLVAFCIACNFAAGQTGPQSNNAPQSGAAWLDRAIRLQDLAQYSEAERAYRDALRRLKNDDSTLYATALDRMGTMYAERGRYSKAEPLERRALSMRQDQNDLAGVGASYMHLALLDYGKHDLRSAETNAEMAVSLLVPEDSTRPIPANATPEEQMSALINLSLVRCARGDSAAAMHHLNRALSIAHAHYPPTSIPVGFLEFLLGYANLKAGDEISAAKLMRTGIDAMEQQLGWGHPTYIAALKQYQTLLAKTGRREEAMELETRIARLEPPSKRGSSGSYDALLDIKALR